MSRRRPKSLDLGLKSVKPETEKRMNTAPNRTSRIRLPTSNIEKVIPSTTTATTTTATTTVATIVDSSVAIQTKQNEEPNLSVSSL
jgi:hypothetical protein